MSSFEVRFRGIAEGFAPLFGSCDGDGAETLRPGTSLFPDFAAPSAEVTPAPEESEPCESGPSADEQAESEREAELRARQAELEAARLAGFAEGEAVARAELAEAVRGFVEATTGVSRFRSDLVDRYHAELLELAIEVARKVIGEEIASRPHRWFAMVREGVQRSLDRERIRIRVGAMLHSHLLAGLRELRAQLDDVKDLELVEEVSLAPYGCVIETAYGELDLTVESQLAAIRAAFTDPT
jgi:flagellar assembly protein FliH